MCKLSLEFIVHYHLTPAVAAHYSSNYQNAHFPDFLLLPLPSNKCIVSSGQKKKVNYVQCSQFHIKTTPQG
uniref:Uncharacterized protein n=1 Tax=Gossypium raimondii TaxID=29730 RepID=A0A0D2SK63_GOSRA|nr:hypothetical protein B456_007G149500 [Gossypium raimondii]